MEEHVQPGLTIRYALVPMDLLDNFAMSTVTLIFIIFSGSLPTFKKAIPIQSLLVLFKAFVN